MQSNYSICGTQDWSGIHRERIKSGKVIHHPVWCEKRGCSFGSNANHGGHPMFYFLSRFAHSFPHQLLHKHHFPSDGKDPGLNWPQLSLRLWKLLPAAIVEVDFLKDMKQNETKKLWFSIASLNNQSVKPPIGLDSCLRFGQKRSDLQDSHQKLTNIDPSSASLGLPLFSTLRLGFILWFILAPSCVERLLNTSFWWNSYTKIKEWYCNEDGARSNKWHMTTTKSHNQCNRSSHQAQRIAHIVMRNQVVTITFFWSIKESLSPMWIKLHPFFPNIYIYLYIHKYIHIM